MINFFRKIRQGFFKEGNTIKYLMYAFGEVVLVVIGILIAIQLDNLNDARKLDNQEEAYYFKLLEDVKQDQLQIGRLLEETNERIIHSNILLGLLQKDELNPETISNEMLQAISLVTFTFKPSISAFEDIKSSGNLGLLRDEKIKTALINYYANIDGIVDVVDINSDESVRRFYDKVDYAKFGWQLIGVVDEEIDEKVVDKKKLRELVIADKEYREKLMSDAIYFVGSGARVKMLYQMLQVKIKEMNSILGDKCSEYR